MQKIISLFTCLCFIQIANAQNAANVTLTKGQKIKMISKDTSNINQKRGEDAMDMKTLSASTTEIEILEVKDKTYIAAQTLKKIIVDFDGYGQKMVYNSEDPAKQEGMMAEQLKDKINKPDTITISFDGKLIEDEKEEGKGKGKGNGRGGGMMKMMQGGANIENSFLLVPAEAKEGSGWKKDNTKDELKSQTIYFIEKIEGNIATVSFKKKTKGTITRSGGQKGGEMKIDMDNLSSGMITVDIKTGLVKSFTETIASKSTTNMMGMDMPSTGTIISNVTFE